jgi:hypothetical protein
MMSEPAWYPRVRPHPDYDGARLVLIDSNTILDLTARRAWDEEMDFLLNAPPARLRLKVNAQVHHEIVGAGAERAGVPAAVLKAQRDFVDAYRRYGKILLDEGQVPFFASSRLTLYRALDEAIARTGNLSVEDRPVATDALANRIPLFTRDRRMRDGLARAMNNRAVKAILRAHGLAMTLPEVSLRD